MASMLKRGLTAALHAPRAVSGMGQGSGAAAQHAGEDGQGYSAAAAAAAAEGKRRPPELALGGQAHSAEEAGESVPSHSARSSSRKWHETGIDSKRTLHVLANPMDGLMGIQTEIPNPAHPSARSDGSWRDSIKDGVKQRVGKGMGSRSSQSSASGTRTGSSASDDDEQGTRKDVRTVCFFIPWPEYDDLPDLPRTNWLKMSRHHAVRRQCANIALHPRIENFWVCVSVLHFLLAIPEFERNVFGCIVDAKTSERVCKISLPLWHHFIFILLYWSEFFLKVTAFGFNGGKFSYWTQNFYNKLDIVATVTYLPEVVTVVIYGASPISCRGLRLLRLFKPVGQLGLFSDLETIFESIIDAMAPMGVVMSLILFVLVLYGIIGMTLYSRSFRRRCVWADNLQIKVPEQYCERVPGSVQYPSCLATGVLNPLFFKGPQQGMNPECELGDGDSFFANISDPELGLDSTCGPFQLCMDIVNPNYGMTSFDNLFASLITLVQFLSGDSDVQILWASFQSAAGFGPATGFFYLSYGFVVIHVLLNVLVAVFANVFANAREANEDKIERRRQGKIASAATPETSASGSRSSSPTGYSNSASPRSLSSAVEAEAAPSDRSGGGSGIVRANGSREGPQGRSSDSASKSGDSSKSRQPTSRKVVKGKRDKSEHKNSHSAISMDGQENALTSSRADGAMREEDSQGSTARVVDVTTVDDELDETAAAREHVQAQLEEMHLEEERIAKEHEKRLAKLPFYKPASWVMVQLKTPVNPSLKALFVFLFRNPAYELITFVVIICIAFCLCAEGSMCIPVMGKRDCFIDPLLNDIVQYSNTFFLADLFAQIIADGSLSQHFESGENFFNFLVNIFTSLSVILPLMGVNPLQGTVPFLRSMAILRLLRGCKYFFLQPIWLMLIKFTGSLIPIMNLIIFHFVFTVIFYIFGRFLFLDKLNFDKRFNFSDIYTGWITLFTVMTGDGWTSIMYQAMSTFCKGGVLGQDCDVTLVAASALYFTIYFFYGQFIFITMFLAIVLDAFAVEEFMEQAKREDDDKMLDKEESKQMVADFQKLPVSQVADRLMEIAWQKLGEPGKSTISRNSLLTLVRMVQPKTKWRLAKQLGLIYMRQVARQTILFPLYASGVCGMDNLLRPYPGDDDYIEPNRNNVVKLNEEQAERMVARTMAGEIREYLAKLQNTGIMGEVLTVAVRLGLLAELNMQDIRKTEPIVGLQLLRQHDLAKRIGIAGVFDALVEEVLRGEKPIFKTPEQIQAEKDAALEFSDFSKDEVTSKSTTWKIMKTRFHKGCWFLVRSPAFDALTFATIITSSVFLCLEPPHSSMATVLEYDTLRLWDKVFNAIFSTEAVAKIGAFGLYTPRHIEYVAYLQVDQNRIDLFVLILALVEMSGGSVVDKYFGGGTMKMVRMMKVLRPVRLLMRSEGLKTIIEALVACRKPIFYAALFLLILCSVFSVMAMALFKKKFYFCTDKNFDGLKGQGEVDCVNIGVTNGVVTPRVWVQPISGTHFDSFGSSVITLVRILTLNWSNYYFAAQDAYEIGYQPVVGFSTIQATAFFELFVLLGSLFGLNLFAGFMCDTFYSLQGTEQLEEVQWLGIQNLLKMNQPRFIRHPPGNIVSSVCREILMSVLWQTFSAGCLLINVAFMATATAEQSEASTRLINIQNDVFFGVLCFESFLNLVAAGPILYITTRSNQFDIFLIASTSITMALGDGLRSISQAVRILRLSKFLRALSKHPTISAVFETVAISMPQVANIVVVMCVVLLIMAALAVQLFGLVRPGWRVGKEANFRTFPRSLQTCFQLMFGEDLFAITDDCRISRPECTDSIYDPVTGEELVPSDCGAGEVATVFFLLYLVLTQYVMLNLFVGMIMNNFAFITTQDGNGVLEVENFVNMAYVWVDKFDPKVTTMIRLEDVLPYYYAIGAPLGHFGDRENNGRFLCVRQELKRKLLDEVDTPFQGGWIYRNIYCNIKEKEEYLYSLNVAEWKNMHQSIQKLENKFAAEAEEQGDTDALRRMNLQVKKRYTLDAEKDGEEDGEEDDEDQKSDAEVEAVQAEPLPNDDIISEGHYSDRALDDDLEDAQGQGHHVAGSNMGGSFGPPTFPRPVWQGESGEGDPGWMALGRRQSMSMTVSGQNMGMGGAPRHVKKVKRQVSNYAGVDYYLSGKHQKKDPFLEAQQRLKDLEFQLVALRKQALEMDTPRPTLWMRFWAFMGSATELLLTDEERVIRKKGHVRYNEVINALMYWNKERNIVPSKVQEQRKDFDEQIITDVAFQLIHGLIRGGIVRRRIRIKKMKIHNRFQMSKQSAANKNKGLSLVRGVMTAKQRMIMQAQDEYASVSNLERLAADENTGPYLHLVIRIVNSGLATGSQLAKEAEDAEYHMGKVGIFTLEEDELRRVFMNSNTLRAWARHVDTVERLQWFVTKAPDHGAAMVRLSAVKHQVDLGGHFEHVNTLPLADLLAVMEEPFVVQSLEEVESGSNHAPTSLVAELSPKGSPTGNSAGFRGVGAKAEESHEHVRTAAEVEAIKSELIAEYTSKIHDERIHLDRIEREADERRMILKESKNRMGHFEREIARLHRARQLQERRRRPSGHESSSDCPTDSEAEMSVDEDGTGEREISLPGATGSPLVANDDLVSRDGIWSQDAVRLSAILPQATAGADYGTRANEAGTLFSADENGEDTDDQVHLLDVDANTDTNYPNARAYNWIDQQSPLSGAPSEQEETVLRMYMGGESAEINSALGEAGDVGQRDHPAARSDAALRPSTAAPSGSSASSELQSKQAARPLTASPTRGARPPTASVEKIEESILFAQAEMERLQRLLRAENARRSKGRPASGAAGFKRTESAEKRQAAIERRVKNQVPDAESETLYGVLTSPRDKPAPRRPGTSSRPGTSKQNKRDKKALDAWA